MKKRLCDLRHGELCIALFDQRERVLMRVIPIDMAKGTFDNRVLMFVQISGRDHTDGHAALYTGLSPDMEVTGLPVTLSVPVFWTKPGGR